MKPQDYFILGTKLFGIWCLLQGFAFLIAAIPSFFQGGTSDPNFRILVMSTTLSTRLVPIFYIFSGIYLIRGGKYIQNLIEFEIKEILTELELKLTFFIKLLGIYLLVNYTPELLKSLSALVTFYFAPPYFDMFQQQSFTIYNGASSIGGVLLGLYCLKSGKIFFNWTISSLKKEEIENLQ